MKVSNSVPLVFYRLDKPFIELGSVEKDLADTEAQLHVTELSGKFEGSIILTPSSLGSFLGSIISNFAADDRMDFFVVHDHLLHKDFGMALLDLAHQLPGALKEQIDIRLVGAGADGRRRIFPVPHSV